MEKLRDEARRNGNLNWDDDFEILVSFLDQHLSDSKVFSDETIGRSTSILARLRKFDDPYTDDDLYDDLGDRVVEYYQYHGSKVHTTNPNLHC